MSKVVIYLFVIFIKFPLKNEYKEKLEKNLQMAVHLMNMFTSRTMTLLCVIHLTRTMHRAQLVIHVSGHLLINNINAADPLPLFLKKP